MYPMPYALFLASCSMGSPMFLLMFLDLVFPYYFQSLRTQDSLLTLLTHWTTLRTTTGVLYSPFYLGYSPIELWDSLSGYVHPGIACLAFWASDWLDAFWASLSGYSSKHDPC